MHVAVIFFAIVAVQFVDSAPYPQVLLTPDQFEALQNKDKLGQILSPLTTKTTLKPQVKPLLPVTASNRFMKDDDDDRPIWGTSAISSANANAQAINKQPGKEQTAGANSYNNNVSNQLGNFHNSGASSIGSDISDDGSKGNVAATNIQNSVSDTKEGYKKKETVLSQSANWDKEKNSLQLTNANVDKTHIKDSKGEKLEQSSGSSATNQNKFGTGQSSAGTNTVDYIENGVKGQKINSQSQASQINKDGSMSNAHSHAGTNTIKNPDGTEVTESKAGSSSVNHGQNGSSGSSAGCNAGGVNQGPGFSSSFSSASSSSYTNANGQTVSQSGSDCGSKSGGAAPQFPAIFPGFGNTGFPFPFQQFPQFNG